MRKLLMPFSLVYWLGVVLRNWFFEIGLLKITTVAVPVISVGNLSAGGVGKTPFVELLIGKFLRKSQLSIVSRGYGRKSNGTVIVGNGTGTFATIEESGDEPLQLAQKYPEAIVIVDEKRVRGARKAIELGARLILLDDGFQHRYLHRELNIVLLTAKEILKEDSLLPSGNRREPWTSLERADLVVVTRCADVQEVERVISSGKKRHLIPAGVPCIGVTTRLKVFKRGSSGEIVHAALITGKKVIVFSGIGNPESFDELLKNNNITVAKHMVFPDHHWYSENDLQRIVYARTHSGADFILTTEKDAVRLNEEYEAFLESEPVIVAEIQQEILSGEDLITEAIQRALKQTES
jgi:tetraacyldisaccharide 4'-kinase